MPVIVESLFPIPSIYPEIYFIGVMTKKKKKKNVPTTHTCFLFPLSSSTFFPHMSIDHQPKNTRKKMLSTVYRILFIIQPLTHNPICFPFHLMNTPTPRSLVFPSFSLRLSVDRKVSKFIKYFFFFFPSSSRLIKIIYIFHFFHDYILCAD